MAHDCMPQATYRSPPTCRLPNDSGRVAIVLPDNLPQVRSQLHAAHQPPVWASTQHVALDCTPQATHRVPLTCRLPNDSGRVAVVLLYKVLEMRN